MGRHRVMVALVARRDGPRSRLCLPLQFPSAVGVGSESWETMKRNLFQLKYLFNAQMHELSSC